VIAAFALLLVIVAGSAWASELPIDFDTQIVPILTRSGCNAGACHGAAAGRGGFRLSLLGANPADDYESIVHQWEGRRINRARAERSLLLAKPTGDLDHGGDLVFDRQSKSAELLTHWIADGAKRTTSSPLHSLAITPHRFVGDALHPQTTLRVVARFDDGSDDGFTRDVTPWTLLTPTDPSAVSITFENSQPVATILRRGSHIVLARFLDRVVPISLVLPFSERTKSLPDHQSDALPTNLNYPIANVIDLEVSRAIDDMGLPRSPVAIDSQWLRRVTIDLTGRLPTPAALHDFLEDQSPDKRAALVNRLLKSEAFVDYWTLRLARLFNLHSLPNDSAATQTYARWIRDSIADNVGFDQMAQELLTATGDSHQVGPANFGRMARDARSHAELVGRVFLGIQIGCANCHNHPLDRWTQDDYHGLAAIFANLDRSRLVRLNARGSVTNPRTGQPAIPRIPGQRYLVAPDGAAEAEVDHRQSLAQWLVTDGRQSLARAMVNRLWQAMLGRGLIDPPDDVRDTNPPSHPDLLEQLANDFVDHRYSLRHTLAQIANSQTYGRSGLVTSVPELVASEVTSNEFDQRFYSRSVARPLMPEVLADAIADVTGVTDSFPDYPAGTRAILIVDPLTPSLPLDILGRCGRVDGCSLSPSERNLATDLHLINGDLINAKITSRKGRLQQMIASGSDDGEIVTAFYRLALSRDPLPAETAHWLAQLASADPMQRRHRLEDFIWAMLNCREFTHNH